MTITIDLTLWELTVLALFLSLSINGLVAILYLGNKKPHLIYKED